jgi:hypothetical protein
MRSAPVILTLLVLLSGCTSEPVPGPVAGPTGPCAAARELPPDGSQEQRLQGDLDGDGRADEVVSWVQDGERVVQAWLATGENAAPEALFDGDLLAAADLDGDGRAEVLVESGEDGAGLALDGCRLAPITVAGTERAWTFAVGPDAALICRPEAVVVEARTTGPDTLRRAWRISAGTATQVDAAATGPVTEPGIACSS